MRELALLVCYGLARHLPFSEVAYRLEARRLRAWCARRLFSGCGDDVNVETGTVLDTGSQVKLGGHSELGRDFDCTGPIHIGDHVLIGPEVLCITLDHRFDRLDIPMREQGGTDDEAIEIGDDVRIGSRVIVLPGVTIGKRAIVGAGTVLPEDVPEYAVVAGAPARVIPSRLAQTAEAAPQ